MTDTWGGTETIQGSSQVVLNTTYVDLLPRWSIGPNGAVISADFYTFKVCSANSFNPQKQACAQVAGMAPPPPPPAVATNPKAVLLQDSHGTKYAQITWTLVQHNTAQWIAVQRRIFLATSNPSGLKAGNYVWITSKLPGNATSYNDLGFVKPFPNDYRVCGVASGLSDSDVACSDSSNRIYGP